MAARFCARCGRALEGEAIRSATRVTPLMARWRMLNGNMTRKETRKLLGEPARVEPPPATAGRDAIELWTYEYEAADRPGERICGAVQFSFVEGRLLTWTEPEWSTLARREDAES